MKQKRGAVSEWLEKKFLEWEHSSGKRQTLSEFSRWLNIPQPVLSNYINGNRTPRGEYINQLADKLGLEIYDLLGLSRPDEDLRELTAILDQLTETEKLKLLDQARDLLKQQQEAAAASQGRKRRSTGPLPKLSS